VHEMLASAGQNILCPIWVSRKKRKNLAHVPRASSILSHLILCGVSVAPVIGQHGRACVAGGGGPSMIGNHRCGGHPRRGGTCVRDFCPEGYCGMGQHHQSREGGTGEGIESGGGERRGVGLRSR
jgi:hypothetical protein